MEEKYTASSIITELYTAPWKNSYDAFRPDRSGLCERPANGIFSSMAVYLISSIIEDAVLEQRSLDDAAQELLKHYSFYRKTNHLLASFLGEWICDLFLVLGKDTKISELVRLGAEDVFLVSDFAAGEFITAFLGKNLSACPNLMDYALRYLSEYDIKKSVYYEKNEEIYRKAVSAVLPRVLDIALAEMGKGFFIPDAISCERSAFMGLPCGCECSRKISVTYIPYSKNYELCAFITAVLKHTDNLIRQGLGGKSKIVGFTLAAEYRKACADAIREAIPDFLPLPAKVGRKPSPKKEKLRREKAEETEQRPEPINLDIDFAKAKRLEAESWKITEMLGADYGGNDISFSVESVYGNDETADETKKTVDAPLCNGKESVNTDIPEDWQEFFASLEESEKQFLCAMSKGFDVNAFSKKRGGMAQGYIDAINEKSSDTYGDIIIEDFDFLEDYSDELKEIFYELYDTEVL